jgi:hypothetical protein
VVLHHRQGADAQPVEYMDVDRRKEFPLPAPVWDT